MKFGINKIILETKREKSLIFKFFDANSVKKLKIIMSHHEIYDPHYAEDLAIMILDKRHMNSNRFLGNKSAADSTVLFYDYFVLKV